MEITTTFKIEPEEFGRFLASVPPEVREQFINAAIRAYPQMVGEFMKGAGITPAVLAPQFDPYDPFGFVKLLSGMTSIKR